MSRKSELIFLFFVSISFQIFSQEKPAFVVKPPESPYDTDLLSKQFHIERRDSLRKEMPDNSVAVLFASPVRNRSNDVDYQYHQDPNFYYYTGYPQADAVVIIFKGLYTINGITSNEFIFANDRNPSKETWTGKIPSKEEVTNTSGIEPVFINTEFENTDIDFSKLSKILVKYPPDINENTIEKGTTGWLVSKFKNKTKIVTENIDRVNFAKINASLREVKTAEELTLLQNAISITCKGFIEALKAAEPGMTEYQLQAINEYFWDKAGSEYSGYPSIVGGGENSCVLHYETNRKKLESSDIVVMDMGAEYHGYTADVTRSFPISGKFSTEQKLIYQLVYDAQKSGIEVCKPGNAFNEPHRAASKVLLEGLKKLGIVTQDDELDYYFMHGTSHYLGLDVHDLGTYGNLKPNSIITVEPGIYIKEGSPCDKKWWNIGVRIEDDVLITNDGYRVMSDCVPKTIAEIEKLMAEKSIFNQIK
ncbi:MAG: aminopeptidase P family protein [Bacteroidota bacterium]